ncbi:hypothetical protein Gohar_028263 [Gossypium harknessii]|uniref:Uncharacterized protein n=1 Tax=Gossypium harknessii TaxID=34285 RepID=A0A7J9ID80_9ROSI|nr:hypothetical protein [Gossypium harknessii]
MINCKEIWLLVQYHRWEHFWTMLKDIDVVPGIEVKVTPRIICDYYNTPFYDQDLINEIELEYFRDIDMDNIISYLIEGMVGWKYHPGTSIPTSFNQKKQVCIRKWIHQNIKRCISGQKVGVFFPHLVMTLCEREGVLMASTEQLLKLSRSIIADTLLHLNVCTFDGGPIVSTIAKDCDVDNEFDDYSSWDEKREMSAWFDDEMYCKETSIWANRVATNQESYDGESNMLEYSIKIGDHKDKLKMVEGVSDLIDIVVDVAANVEGALTTNIELEPIPNESVEEPIHFLAIVGEFALKNLMGSSCSCSMMKLKIGIIKP